MNKTYTAKTRKFMKPSYFFLGPCLVNTLQVLNLYAVPLPCQRIMLSSPV